MRRLKPLEDENAKLKKLVADLSVDLEMLRAAAATKAEKLEADQFHTSISILLEGLPKVEIELGPVAMTRITIDREGGYVAAKADYSAHAGNDYDRRLEGR